MATDERKCYTIDFNEKENIILTSKQFLVYSFLLAKSDSTKDKCYLYKVDFTPAIFAKELGVSRPTFNSAVKKLIDVGLIVENKNYFTFKILKSFVPLPIETIEQLIKWGKRCKNGGYLIPVFCGIYKFFHYCHQNNLSPDVSIETIKQIYFKTTNRSKKSDELFAIQSFFNVLQWIGLINYEIKIDGKGRKYVITFVTKEIQGYADYEEKDIDKFLDSLEYGV